MAAVPGLTDPGRSRIAYLVRQKTSTLRPKSEGERSGRRETVAGGPIPSFAVYWVCRMSSVRESALFYWTEPHTRSLMAKNDTVGIKVREIAERVGASEGLEIVDVELSGGGKARLLRIYIDKPEGVTHADCETISHQVGTILDVEDVIPGGAYTLEVSSPGVERKLTKPADFERFRGQKAKITLREPVENSKHWTGTLAGIDQNIVRIEPEPGKLIQFSFDQIQKANLKFEW